MANQALQTAPVFTDAVYLSAKQKLGISKAWRRFLHGGLLKAHFTKDLYEYLHGHAGFIAHYSLAQFYATYFKRGDDTLLFLEQISHNLSRPQSLDCEDLHADMLATLGLYYDALAAMARANQRNADIAEARRLLARHGLAAVIPDA
jgi:hypothetical protein